MASTFINYIKSTSIHEQTAQNGNKFCNVSIPCKDSVTGFATIAVNPGQIMPTTDKNQQTVLGYNNVLLGKADGKRKVNVCKQAKTDTAEAVYETIEMTNAEIGKLCAASRKAYKAAQKAAETEATAE